jgi:hypothetical protein
MLNQVQHDKTNSVILNLIQDQHDRRSSRVSATLKKENLTPLNIMYIMINWNRPKWLVVVVRLLILNKFAGDLI